MTNIASRLSDPQRAYQFYVSFTSPFGYGENIDLFVKNTSIPMQTMGMTKKNFGGAKYGVPTREETPSVLTITFWDSEILETYYYFLEWYKHISLGTEHHKLTPEHYLRDIKISMLRSDGKTVSKRIKMKDAFPTEIGEAVLSYDETAPFTFDVKFFFNDMEF